MKPTKAATNREHVTCFIGRVELTTYNDKGEIVVRRTPEIVAIQADIPEPVRQFLKQRVRMQEQPAKEQ